MVARNVSRIARQAQYAVEDAQPEAEAIRQGLDPALRDIEVQSGMVRDANVLPNRLLTDGGAGATMSTYYSALANKLPGYVNARRAYEEALKKKKEGDGSDSPYTMNYMQPPTLPPITTYLPQVGTVDWAQQGLRYVVSPYGAVPYGAIPPKTGAQPPARVLAQRRVVSTRPGKAGIE